MPGPALAQKDPNAEALKDLDTLKGINDKLDRLKELDTKGPARTEKENDEKKDLDTQKEGLEKRKTRIEEGLQQQRQGAAQGFAPLAPGTVQKLNDYFELQQAKKDLEDELKKGDKQNKRKVERLRKRIAELQGTTPPTAKDPNVKAGLTIVEGDCDTPKCTVGR